MVRFLDESIGEIRSTSSQDGATATVRVSSGVALDSLLRTIVPKGFFLPVTPGTKSVTVGGAVAADVHGKNHHVDGSLGNHVESLTLLLADGSIAEVGPNRNPDLFWATLGGMGLTGVVLDATIRLIPIETSSMVVETTRASDLDELLSLMSADSDDAFRYSVAWIDLCAPRNRLGRGVLTRANHALAGETGAKSCPSFAPRIPRAIPRVIENVGLMSPRSINALDSIWFHKSPKSPSIELDTIDRFFYPLDGVGNWNRVYGRKGFVQYQVAIPSGSERALREILESFSADGVTSFVSVLKRFGPANAGFLSFPFEGWALSVDVPAETSSLSAALTAVDERVLSTGGRHYLAKDSHMTPSALRRGYPRLRDWQAVRESVDPSGTWQSDLARRLRMLDRHSD